MTESTRPLIATLTLSDTRTEADDQGGASLRRELERAGFRLHGHAIVREEPSQLRLAIEELLSQELIDAIVMTGGTGISPRDRTFEVVEPLLDKRLDGFGEAFRRLSWDQVGPRSVLSRALAGVSRGRVLVALPGSVKAVELAVTALLAPLLDHACALARGRAHGHQSSGPGGLR